MKKIGILNQPVSAVIAGLGHTDTLCVADAGLPIPAQTQRIDLALTQGIPSFLDTLPRRAGRNAGGASHDRSPKCWRPAPSCTTPSSNCWATCPSRQCRTLRSKNRLPAHAPSFARASSRPTPTSCCTPAWCSDTES